MSSKIIDAVRLPHACPNCTLWVINRLELNKFFGTRVLNKERRVAQSWCRTCRAAERLEKKKLKESSK